MSDIIIQLTEEYEIKIHKILRTNPFTKYFNIEIEKNNNGLYKEFYIYSNLIEQSLIFLIKNIKYYNDLDELFHLLSIHLSKLNLK